MAPVVKQNLISAFRESGVVPINKQEILNRMPRQDIDVNLNTRILTWRRVLNASYREATRICRSTNKC
jgi:hypothetical protein